MLHLHLVWLFHTALLKVDQTTLRVYAVTTASGFEMESSKTTTDHRLKKHRKLTYPL